jgi:hypothetical protein
MKFMTRQCLALGSLVLLATAANAETYPFEGDNWQIEAKESEVVEYLGERAVRIKGGYATINGLELEEGIIEFDIAVSEARGFAGAIFRVQDLANYEHFYIRPHQSGKADASQYTPVFNGVSAWQLYHGEGHGSPVEYKFDAWMHIKIAFAGDQAEVFIDSDEPVLIVDDLRREDAAGGIGFGGGNFSAAHYANFSVSPLPRNYQFVASNREPPKPESGTILSWQVSAAMAEDVVGQAMQSEQQWSVLKAEPTGVTNLSRADGVERGKKMVIARLVVKSDTEQLKELAFGYSDTVTVYVNGVPLYAGTNRYQSRDFRYLGTIGLFDRVFLPLNKGENEVRFVVTEAFGGWGIQAQFDDLEGISLPNEP